MSNPGHTRPGSLRPGFTRLPDGRGRMVVFAEKLSSGEQFRAELRLTKGELYSTAERVDCTGTRMAHLAGLRLVEDGTQQTQDGWFYVRTYEDLHATAETLIGAPRVLRGDDGRVTVEQDWLQFAAAKATPQRVGTTTCPTWPVAYTGVTGTASTDTFTLTAHGLLAGDPVRFSALTGGSGLATGTTYYVISDGLTADAFKLSATSGGAAINFTTNVTAATLALYLVAILATEQAPDDGTLRRITRRYVTRGVVATRSRYVGQGIKEVSWTSVLVREDPPGVLVGDPDVQNPGGVPVYTVTARQSATGGDLLDGSVVSTVGLETTFEYPGRCNFIERTETVGAVNFNFTDLQQSPPVSAIVDAVAEVRYARRSSLAPVAVTGTASSNVINFAAHQLPNGWPVHFTALNPSTGTGLALFTRYYIVNATADTIQLASTVGGAAIDITVNISAATLVPYAYPRWNPTSWPVLDAFYMMYNDIAGARSKVEGLRGYRLEEPTPTPYTPPAAALDVTFASAVGEAAVAFGGFIATTFSGQGHIYGGPPKPGGLTWTLSAKPEEAFVDSNGAQIYRHTIITAAIPEQETLPA